MKIKKLISLLAFTGPLLIGNAVSAATDFDGWSNMTSTTLSGYGTGAWPAAIGSNVSGSGDALFNKVSGSGYAATMGIQSAALVSVFSIYDNSALADLKSLTLTLDWQSSTAVASIAPVLNLNGGAQAIAAFDVTGAGTASQTYTWDVSDFGSEIDSFAIDFTAARYSTVLSISLTQSDVSAVPEPSSAAALAGAIALGFVVCRRKRASSKVRA